MKHLLFIIVGIMFTLCYPTYDLAAAGPKIAVVDMEKLQEKSQSFKMTRELLRQKFEDLQQKLKQEKDELVKIEEELRKQSMMLSLDAKVDKQKQLQKKARYIKYLQNEYSQEMKDAEKEAREKVGIEIEEVVRKIGKKGGYTLILNKGAVGLIYSDNALDITDEVIKGFDKKNK
ncbi:MAG: OmpH family outer membrane protein [Desulfatiglans sp.]|nr:OmpH family outer membrane protein [Thermodesulfobacteriota bacterium]MEE4351607.1 OmpH family outer membrane protein [Desulfatiglans sp.]